MAFPFDEPDPPRREDTPGSPGDEQPDKVLPAGLLAQAIRSFDAEETADGLREVRATGGLELKDFLQDLEREAIPRE